MRNSLSSEFQSEDIWEGTFKMERWSDKDTVVMSKGEGWSTVPGGESKGRDVNLECPSFTIFKVAHHSFHAVAMFQVPSVPLAYARYSGGICKGLMSSPLPSGKSKL